MHCQAIDGYQENGVPDKAHLMTVQDSMMRAGKKVKVMISTPLQIDVLSKVDEWESKVDEVCGTFEVLGACGVEAVLLFNFMKAAEASEREERAAAGRREAGQQRRCARRQACPRPPKGGQQGARSGSQSRLWQPWALSNVAIRGLFEPPGLGGRLGEIAHGVPRLSGCLLGPSLLRL